MRIVHIITRLILGGAQENTLLACEDLIRCYNDEVYLLTGPPLGPEGSLVDRARAGGVPLEIVPWLRRAINPWYDFQAYRHLKKLIRSIRPDVVHTHSAKAGILGRAVAWKLDVPAIVHTVHGAPFHPYQPRLARWFVIACERWAAKRCHAFISVADAMTDLLVAAHVAPREKFTTIYSGMEVERFLQCSKDRPEMRQKLGYREGDIVIGTIARLFHLKGHDDILAAAERLIPQYPQLRFLWVGDGILRSKLERTIRARGWEKRFYLAGLVLPEDLPKWISAMDIVVHTSLREGLARVLPQSLLAEKPVISYDVDGAKEVVFQGKTGFLVQPRDIQSLSEALSRLIESPDMRRNFGVQGRVTLRERFDHVNMTKQIRELYLYLLERQHDTGR